MISEFLDNWHIMATRLAALHTGHLTPPPTPTRRYSWYSFLLEAEPILETSCGRKDLVIADKTRNIPGFRVVPQQIAPPRNVKMVQMPKLFPVLHTPGIAHPLTSFSSLPIALSRFHPTFTGRPSGHSMRNYRSANFSLSHNKYGIYTLLIFSFSFLPSFLPYLLPISFCLSFFLCSFFLPSSFFKRFCKRSCTTA